MSIFRQSDETNYWPSISDMFLVFFIIALGLLAYSTRDRGDAYTIDFVVEESNMLFKRLGNIEAYDIRSETDPKRPRLAEKLMEAERILRQDATTGLGAVPDAEATQMLIESAGETLKAGEPVEFSAKSRANYHIALRSLAWCVLSGEMAYKDPSWRALCEWEGKQYRDILLANGEPAENADNQSRVLQRVFLALRDDMLLRHANNVLGYAGFTMRFDEQGAPVPSQDVNSIKNKLSDYTRRIIEWNRLLHSCLEKNGQAANQDPALLQELQENMALLCEQNHRLKERIKGLENTISQYEGEQGDIDYLRRIQDWNREISESIESRGIDSSRSQNPVEALGENITIGGKLISSMAALIDKQQGAINLMNQKLVDSQTREQHVILGEEKVKFKRGTVLFSDEPTALAAISTAAEQMRANMDTNFARSSEFVVEIIGHTDIVGSSLSHVQWTPEKEAEALEDDASNPHLGLRRADVVRCNLQKVLGNSYTKNNISKPIRYCCYSGSWLTPFQQDAPEGYGRGDEAQQARNRRVEVYLRPVPIKE